MTLIEKIEKGIAVVGIVGSLAGIGGIFYHGSEEISRLEKVSQINRENPAAEYRRNFPTEEQAPYMFLATGSAVLAGLGLSGYMSQMRRIKEAKEK